MINLDFLNFIELEDGTEVSLAQEEFSLEKLFEEEGISLEFYNTYKDVVENRLISRSIVESMLKDMPSARPKIMEYGLESYTKLPSEQNIEITIEEFTLGTAVKIVLLVAIGLIAVKYLFLYLAKKVFKKLKKGVANKLLDANDSVHTKFEDSLNKMKGEPGSIKYNLTSEQKKIVDNFLSIEVERALPELFQLLTDSIEVLNSYVKNYSDLYKNVNDSISLLDENKLINENLEALNKNYKQKYNLTDFYKKIEEIQKIKNKYVFLKSDLFKDFSSKINIKEYFESDHFIQNGNKIQKEYISRKIVIAIDKLEQEANSNLESKMNEAKKTIDKLPKVENKTQIESKEHKKWIEFRNKLKSEANSLTNTFVKDLIHIYTCMYTFHSFYFEFSNVIINSSEKGAK